ncbi:diguanylate cyclase [Rhodoblastus sp.]|uniref:diguanylate cyclase n=1 Tax=Rhodoblastus sp. TaxID=1962975 RepID=UPI002625E5D6|nr:diguanylate cyclase [Rhodoblastus sp.]
MRVVLLASQNKMQESIASILETRGHDIIPFAAREIALQELIADRTANALIVVNHGNLEAAIETCWEARLLASSERPLYICLVSRPMPSEAVVEALDCGADDVMQLPLSANELYARLRSAERLYQMQLKLVEMATRDGLTGLLNRPAFFERATRVCREATAPFAAIMADIDHFKAVNDKFGHAAGDKALISVAECLGRRGEVAARLGGEEFVLLLHETDSDRARLIAEDLRRSIALRAIELDGMAMTLSCSFGVALAEPGANIDQLLRRADTALYDAKRGGRNRVRVDCGDTFIRPPDAESLIRHAGDRFCSARQGAVG